MGLAQGGISLPSGQQFPAGTGARKSCGPGSDAGAPHPLLQAATFSLSHLFSSQQCPDQQHSGVSGCGGFRINGE